MVKKSIECYGYTEFYKEQVEELNKGNKGLIPARIIAVHKEKYKIAKEFSEKTAVLKGSEFYYGKKNNVHPAVGDFVLVKENPYGEDIIYKVLERKSKFSRNDSYHGREQIVASNFDYVFIMTSQNKEFNIKRIERYLTITYESGAIPIIIISKSDLCDDVGEYEEQLKKIAIGVPILAVSSVTRDGFEELSKYIKPLKTIVFLGSSGVGKSSLLNALAGEEIMKVSEIREDDSKGRHTTTHRELIMLENGAMIIDTPGMREVGMWVVVSDGIDTMFGDIQEIEKRCKFTDCSHRAEPGCAIKEAIEKGEISMERWENYEKIKREVKLAEYKRSDGTSRRQRHIYRRIRRKAFGYNQWKTVRELKKIKVYK